MNDSTPTDSSQVFVVYGRNTRARTDLFSFLRAIGLKPIEWSQATKLTRKGTPTVSEILDAAFERAQAVVVLLTGDDETRLRELFRKGDDAKFEGVLTPQARPNVLFEAGMAFGRFPNRTILVELGSLRPFSDIAGRHTIRLNNTIQQRQELAQRLITAGCSVDLAGVDWHNVGNFDASDENLPGELEPSNGDQDTEESNGVERELHADAIEILKQVASYENYIYKSDLQQGTRMNSHRFAHFLKILIDLKFLEENVTRISLTDGGRAFLVDNDHI